MHDQQVLTLIAIVLGGLIVMGGRKIAKSTNEGARRLRWVLLGAAILAAGAFSIDTFGLGGTAAAAVILGVIAWVAKGFKQK